LVRGKGTEVIVEACTKLNLPLKVVGSGPELERLKKIAGNNVEFLGLVSDEKLPEILAGAKATIVASEDEDFGIVPVESMAAGTPVIAVRAGGFLETIIEGKTGEFFEKATPESLEKVLKEFNPEKYRSEDCIKQAEKFSKEEFKKKMSDLIDKKLQG
jgi:glycosyltransferase involved in cell wall biosynthesis